MLLVLDDLGTVNVSVVIQDQQGNLLESGQAEPFRESAECWSYVATVSLPPGTSVIVHAAATDCLGGTGTLHISATT